MTHSQSKILGPQQIKLAGLHIRVTGESRRCTGLAPVHEQVAQKGAAGSQQAAVTSQSSSVSSSRRFYASFASAAALCPAAAAAAPPAPLARAAASPSCTSRDTRSATSDACALFR